MTAETKRLYQALKQKLKTDGFLIAFEFVMKDQHGIEIDSNDPFQDWATFAPSLRSVASDRPEPTSPGGETNRHRG